MIAAALLVLACPLAHVYKPSRLTVLKCKQTVTGVIEGKRVEPDGDLHILVQVDSQYRGLLNQGNIRYQSGDLVVEVVCAEPVTQADAIEACYDYASPIKVPAIGSRVRVTGPLVRDHNHEHWIEIHEVEEMEKIP